MLTDQSHKTAVSRRVASAPMRALEGRIRCRLTGLRILTQSNYNGFSLLDYGCGKGFDADYYGLEKYDPHYFPELPPEGKLYNFIFCNYVLNVVEEPVEADIISKVAALLEPTGRAFFSVRRDLPFSGRRMSGYSQRYSLPTSNMHIDRKYYAAIHTFLEKTNAFSIFVYHKMLEEPISRIVIE